MEASTSIGKLFLPTISIEWRIAGSRDFDSDGKLGPMLGNFEPGR